MSSFKEFYNNQINDELERIGVAADIINKYNFTECIADTCSSTTYIAVHKVLKTKHFIKIYKNTYQAEEYKILSDLEHEGIPRMIDVITDENHTIVIEEYFDGKTLDAVMNEANDFSKARLIDIFLKTCEILKFLHSQNPPVIHKDIKPDNIMMNKNGDVKLIDFGSARSVKENQSTDTVLLGTQGYAAPEQYGFRQTDERTDIYSLGVTINEIAARFAVDLNSKHKKIIAKCREIDPGNRYRRIEDLIEEIKDADKPLYRKKKFPYIFAFAVCVCVLGLIGYSSFYSADVYHFKSDIVAEAVSSQIGKSISEITLNDMEKITEINIWGEQIINSSDELTWESNPGNYVSSFIINGEKYTARGALDTLDDFRAMKNLYALQLVKQNITDLSPLSELEIVHLYLNDNRIEDITPLKNVTSLYTLEIAGNPVSDFSVIENLTAIGELDISDTLCDELAFLQEHTSIEMLKVRNLEIEHLDFLTPLYKLRYLDLEFNRITDLSDINGLDKLEYLNIANNPIKKNDGINEMKSIKSVVIRDTGIDESLISDRISIVNH